MRTLLNPVPVVHAGRHEMWILSVSTTASGAAAKAAAAHVGAGVNAGARPMGPWGAGGVEEEEEEEEGVSLSYRID